MSITISEELGHLFEVGFNTGILACIGEYQIKHKFGDFYFQELQQLKWTKILKQITGKFISPVEREIAEKWSIFFLQKGFLGGLNFFREYIQGIGWGEGRKLKNVEILYYQSRFDGANSLGTYDNKNTQQWFGQVLGQFDNLKLSEIEQYVQKYIWQDLDFGKKGEFVNADTLMLLRCRQEIRVLCVDLSVFSIKSEADIKNLDYVEAIRHLLMKDISYLRSKSVFSQLSIDTESFDLEFSPDLKSYFTAFKYQDKESAKLIQGGAYTYSFYEFLQEVGIVNEESKITFNIVGYSDRTLGAMSIRPENLPILQTCYEIYTQDISPKQITDARKQVLNRIKRSAYSSFDQGKNFIDALLAVNQNQINIISHQEQITGFFNSVGKSADNENNLRQAHADLIKKELDSDSTYIFLTGNPGIGKTTAIVEYLKKHIDEGFLFFYVSPRIQVNLDIIEKFKDQTTGKLCDDRIFALNSNHNLIVNNSGKYTVKYVCNQRQGNFSLNSVNFHDSNIELKTRRNEKIQRITEDTLKDIQSKTTGVLNSVCEAIATLIGRKESENIVATAAIQSLKKTELGDTLKHFEKIFRNAYNERQGSIIAKGMKDISQRIKHLFIMIDEITGDHSGVEFLDGISNILSKYQLTDAQYGFNTKVIVADASIVDANIITQHLTNKSPEPDKIYFRKATSNAQPLSIQRFIFKNLPATVINTNSYPANSLSFTYKVILQCCQFRGELDGNNGIVKSLQNEILTDFQSLLQRPDVEQVIIYIQNKQRLAELIEKIKLDKEFIQFQDYIEIHANISEVEKQEINNCKNKVKVVFMTASGSRGLSFPKAKHILVEIPGFEIEKNLMEIIQVIYRGRGDNVIDNQHKELLFYLGESSVYYQDDPEHQQLALQESILNLINILLLLKAAIMTRIFGYGQIGKENFLVIPIGGKSIFAAGETFSGHMSNIIKQLKQEYRRNRQDTLVQKIYQKLEQLLSNAEFTISNQNSHYFKLREDFNQRFSQLCSSFEQLLPLGKVESGYISGSLLIVPIGENNLEEKYQMGLLDIANYADETLWRDMRKVSCSQFYPESLRFAIKDAMDFVQKVNSGTEKTQKFEQNSQHLDQYYTIPLFTFILGDVIKEYFANDPQEEENESFRELLAKYIRLLYPVNNILPIGNRYKEFPFIVFRSYSLEEMRRKTFLDKYILTSHELSVLNLILSK